MERALSDRKCARVYTLMVFSSAHTDATYLLNIGYMCILNTRVCDRVEWRCARPQKTKGKKKKVKEKKNKNSRE